MALDCPRCQNIQLEEIEIGDVLVDRCPRCAGLWFDHAEIGEITGPESRIRKVESMVPQPQFSSDVLNCPHCEGVSLRELNSQGKKRKHTVYRCVSCVGTWLDRGQLREIEDPRLLETLKNYFVTAYPDQE